MFIDVYQDTVCPWCRIGLANLRIAIEQLDGEPTSVRWCPFELRPNLPVQGRDFTDLMAEIKGDRNLQPLFDRVCLAGEPCGLTFNFDRIERMPNTLLSHTLMAVSPPELQSAVLEAIHEAYFERGRDIGNREVLLDIADRIGLDRAKMGAGLDDPVRRAAVAQQANWAREQGITGVPYFVFGNAISVSGAQPAGTLLAAIQQASAAGVTG